MTMTNDNRQSTAATYGVSVNDVVIIDGSPTIDGMEPAEWYEAVHGDGNIEDDIMRIMSEE